MTKMEMAIKHRDELEKEIERLEKEIAETGDIDWAKELTGDLTDLTLELESLNQLIGVK